MWVDFARQRERGTTLSRFPSVNLKTNMSRTNSSFISSGFTLVLSICREEIGIWPAPACVCGFYYFYFGLSIKFTLLQGCPPRSSFLILMNSHCIPAALSCPMPAFMCGWLGCLSRSVFVSCKARPVWFESPLFQGPLLSRFEQDRWIYRLSPCFSCGHQKPLKWRWEFPTLL